MQSIASLYTDECWAAGQSSDKSTSFTWGTAVGYSCPCQLCSVRHLVVLGGLCRCVHLFCKPALLWFCSFWLEIAVNISLLFPTVQERRSHHCSAGGEWIWFLCQRPKLHGLCENGNVGTFTCFCGESHSNHLPCSTFFWVNLTMALGSLESISAKSS